MGQLWKKIADTVNADIRFEDESKQFTVMIRVTQIVLILYFTLFELLSLIFWREGNRLLVVPWIALLVFSFGATYRLRTRVTFHLISFSTLLWTYLFVRYFGWELDSQNFLLPLLLVSFFASYDNLRGKLAYTGCMLAYYLFLFWIAKAASPLYELDTAAQSAFQTLNMCTLFVVMFYICWTFSSTNQEAEKKLAFYNKRLQHEARTDALTGLWNRRSMIEYLEKRLNAYEEGKCFSIAIGDIDFFKRVNDTRGHNCGDEVLRRIAGLLSEYMADHGAVCRWGGEEFFFAFPDNGDLAFYHIEQIRTKIQNMVITDPDKKEDFSVTMTFGVEEHDFESTGTELIKRADDKLYQGKDQGRNRTIY